MPSNLVPRVLVLGLALAFAATACAPDIGDACVSSIECPQGSTCDTTAINGYCLILDCNENTCPEGSICVPFSTFSACMKACAGNDDCRTDDEQVCLSDPGPVSFCYHPDDA